MPVTLGIKASADVGNQVSFGTDSGIYVPTPARHSGSFLSTIDNNWGSDSTTWYYAQTMASSNGAGSGNGGAIGTAQLWPLMVTRTCRVTDVYYRVVSAVSVGTYYLSLYASDATLNTPGAKIVDIGSGPLTSAGHVRVQPGSTITLTAGVQYWVAAVQRTGTALANVNTRGPNFGSLRLTGVPSYALFTGFTVMGYTDSTFASASPATATPTAADPVNPSAPFVYTPYLWWGLSNQ